MTRKILVVLPVLVTAIYAAQTSPGTSTRSILSHSEASSYTVSAYLHGWSPSTIKTTSADFTVGSGGLSTIQAAVNAAIQSATMSGSDYAKQVNPNGARYKDGDPAWKMFDDCASRATIGTSCSAVFWAANQNLEVAYLTVDNPETNGQSVAARAAGEEQNWDNVNFFGFQDTLLVSGNKIYFHKTTIKGDVDFIFGEGAAVFDSAEITARADRPRNTAVVFAASTDGDQKYGYLVVNSHITAEIAIASNTGCSLARAWDPTSKPNANGQLVIRETTIDAVANVNAPYQAATSGRAFSGNINTTRNLDDKNFNRFWEYKNTGGGA